MAAKVKIVRVTTVPVSFIKLLEGQLGYMSSYFDMIAVSSSGDGQLDLYGKSERIRTKVIPMTRKITPLQDFISLVRMIIFLLKERPIIIHSHTPKAGLISMLSGFIVGIPHRLHTVAGLPLVETTGNKRRLLIHVEKIIYKCATKVYPNSLGLLQIILKEKICTPDKVKIIGHGSSNGIDTNYFNPSIYNDKKSDLKKKYDIGNDDFVFIYIGRLVKDKGLNELISAFINAFSDAPKVKLLLVGNFENNLSPLDDSTISYIKTTPNIRLLGYKDDIRPYLAMSDIFVFPSYREGFPNVVMQSLSMNVPVIANNINGCNELVIDGQNGYLIPPKDKNILEKKMIFVVNNLDKLKELKCNSRKKLKDKYERSYVWELILNEYLRVLSN